MTNREGPLIGDEKKTRIICFRASPRLADEIDSRAREERRHRGELVRHMVEDALEGDREQVEKAEREIP